MLSREVFLLHLKLAFDKKRSLFKPKPLDLDTSSSQAHCKS